MVRHLLKMKANGFGLNLCGVGRPWEIPTLVSFSTATITQHRFPLKTSPSKKSLSRQRAPRLPNTPTINAPLPSPIPTYCQGDQIAQIFCLLGHCLLWAVFGKVQK
jgi:hypothetical protein